MEFYASIFPDATQGTNRGSGLSFEIAGQSFIAFDGGAAFRFNEAVSMYVDCADQDEVDYYWERLTSDGGEESTCGWLKDKFGLSWLAERVRFTQPPATMGTVTTAVLDDTCRNVIQIASF